MTLKKDDKTAIKKQKSKAKVWLKPQRVKEQVKEVQKKPSGVEVVEPVGRTEKIEATKEEDEEKDWEAKDDDDSSGPSGRSLSPEEREKNLQELYRHQRNFLRRLLVDTDDEEEEQDDIVEQNTLE